MCLPSGDQRASVAARSGPSQQGNGRGDPPPVGMMNVWDARVFLVTSAVRTAYRICFPSGDGCGSLTARTAAKSSNVMVCFCWETAGRAIRQAAATIRNEKRIGVSNGEDNQGYHGELGPCREWPGTPDGWRKLCNRGDG